ncbi:MAG: transposase [Nitrospirae bacterium]|nr:transposase [Nitrospirota bacterium]
MARPLRIEYPGAFYHITARGNERKDIFRDEKDRERFLNYLETSVGRYKAVIHAYCLMSNHYHLLLTTPEGNLSQIMRHINGGYTTYFNKQHKRSGHLFQGRYKAILVEADPYAGELSRYIHLNPVRAGMARQAEKYKWTSYTAYIGNTKTPHWLTIDWLLQYFGRKTSDARKGYRFFVEAAVGSKEDPLKETTSTLILGTDKFIENIREKYLIGKEKGRDIPALRELTKISLDAIIKAVEQECGDKPEISRKAAIYISHRYSGRTLREIGQRFGVGESAVARSSGRFEAELKEA